jgi:hypothetical protein
MTKTAHMTPRLMTKAEAAGYCRMSPAIFERVCPVRPLRFSERLVLFDVVDIDSWIEAYKGPAKKTGTDWLSAMGDD